MTQDFGRAPRAKSSGGGAIALIILALIAGAVGYGAYTWHKAWGGTGTSRNTGAHIYGELKALEPDVLSGKIKDPNDPRLDAVGKEISAYRDANQNLSFNDSMLFADLSQYQSALSMMAMSNGAPASPSSIDRGRDLTLIKRLKDEVEKYLK